VFEDHSADKPAFFGWTTNYLIDVEAASAIRDAEVESTKVMIDRMEHRSASGQAIEWRYGLPYVGDGSSLWSRREA
jgi:hypothetical protein